MNQIKSNISNINNIYPAGNKKSLLKIINPCFKEMLQNPIDQDTSNIVFNLAVHMNSRGFDKAEIIKLLSAWNKINKCPLNKDVLIKNINWAIDGCFLDIGCGHRPCTYCYPIIIN